MKRISLILLLLFLSSTLVFSQEDTTNVTTENANGEYKTLFKQEGKTKVSGFGGITMEFSGVNKEFAYSMGGVGAILFNQSFFIGFYGQGLVNFPKYTYSAPHFQNEDESIMFAHGGFYIGYIFQANKPFHFGVSSKFGWGGITLFDNYNNSYPPNYYYEDYPLDNVFVITPQVEAEMNIAKWFKVNMGLGYRITTGVDATYDAFNSDGIGVGQVPYFESNAFNCMTFQLGFYFGWFK